MQVKQTVRDLLERLPDDCSLDDVLYHLYVLQATARGFVLCVRNDGSEDLEPRKVYSGDRIFTAGLVVGADGRHSTVGTSTATRSSTRCSR